MRALPRFTSPKVRSMLDLPDIKAYSDLASAYGSNNTDKLLRVAEQHMATFSSVSWGCSLVVVAVVWWWCWWWRWL